MRMKYYYDCPIEAAYMQKYHGIKLQVLAPNYTGGWTFYDYCPGQPLLHGANFGKFYIHPDSLSLLEPEVGDLGILCDDVYTFFDSMWRVEDDTNILNNIGQSDVAIIRRDSKPFIMPKIEASND